jgi:beta-glucosidase
MAVEFVKGLQGNDPKYLKVVATAKHFAVHSGPESSRHSFDAKVDEEHLAGSYLPHFEAAIREGDAYSVMCAYNRVDGDPSCASPRLIGDILRKQWGFFGIRGFRLRCRARDLPRPTTCRRPRRAP